MTKEMLICLHCEKPGISLVRRLCLGPALPARCVSCGKKIGISYFSIIAVIPLIAGAAYAVNSFDTLLAYASGVFSLFFAMIISYVLFSMQKRS